MRIIVFLFFLAGLGLFKKLLEVSDENPELYWWENIRNWINRH